MHLCIALCPSTRSLLTEGINFVLFTVLSAAPGIVFNTFRDSIFVVWITGCVFVPLESFWNGNFIPEHKTGEKLFLYYFCFKFYFNSLICLCGSAGSYLRHTGTSSAVQHVGPFSCSVQTLSCGVWDLVSWTGNPAWAPCIGIVEA